MSKSKVWHIKITERDQEQRYLVRAWSSSSAGQKALLDWKKNRGTDDEKERGGRDLKLKEAAIHIEIERSHKNELKEWSNQLDSAPGKVIM